MLKVISEGLPAEPHPRRGLCSAVYEGGFYVWHGSWKVSNYHDYEVDTDPFTLYRLDLQTLRWDELLMKGQDLSGYEPLTCASYTQHHKYVFTFGGHLITTWFHWGRDPFCNDVYRIDLDKLEVSLLPCSGQIPFNRDKTSLFFYKDALFLFGGWSQCPASLQPGAKFQPHVQHQTLGWNNEFYRYDLVTREWCYQPLRGEVPPPTAASDFARVGDRVYLVAGRNPLARVDDVYVLNLPTMEWSHFCKPPLPHPPVPWPAPRSSHRVSPIFRTGGTQTRHLLLFGGLSQKDTAYKDVWLLDLTSMSWQQQQLCNNEQIEITGRTWFSMGAVLNEWSGCFELCLFGGIPGSLEDALNEEMSDTLLLEMGISSLKRLACSVVVANLPCLEGQIGHLPPLLVNNLRQLHTAGNTCRVGRVLNRFSPFKNFPDISHLYANPSPSQET